MVFNITFNNISFISWRSVLLVEEINHVYTGDMESKLTNYRYMYIRTTKLTNYRYMYIRTTTLFCMYNKTIFNTTVTAIGGGNRRTQRKPLTCPKSLTHFIT
jgi:hypothetical protein